MKDTNHLSEDQLIRWICAEPGEPQPPEQQQHLRTCPECGKQVEELERLVKLVGTASIPERNPAYADELWQRLAPRLDNQSYHRGSEASMPTRAGWRGAYSWTALAAAVIVGAFLVGRLSTQWFAGPVETANPQQVRERVLMIAVGEHLQRSEVLLTELANGGAGTIDWTVERQQADALVGENRLFRQSASQLGDAGLEDVLDGLERVLLDLAHSQEKLGPGELETLQQRISSQGLLFKIKVVNINVRKRQRPSSNVESF